MAHGASLQSVFLFFRHVLAAPWRAIRCRSKRLAGPWKNSGNWWDRESWNREEWDVELASGGLYRVVWEAGQWVIDGVYD